MFPFCFPSVVHRLIPHQFVHQICEGPIGIHQLRRRTDKIVRQMFHASKEAVLKNVIRPVHPIRNLYGEAQNRRLVLRD